jgi:CRP-like cAMP-binding protein
MIEDVLLVNRLNREEMEKFKAALTKSSLKKTECFISSGQICRYMALVENGYLRTYHVDDHVNEITTEFNGPDTFCSSFYSFYTHEPPFEFIEAITDCDLFLLSFDSLRKLYADSFSMNVFGRTVLEKACIEIDLRHKKIIHLSAAEKYKWFLENYADIYKVAKLGHIAGFLGIKQETLSRIRRKIISD